MPSPLPPAPIAMEDSLSRRRFLALVSAALGLGAIGCPAGDPIDEATTDFPDRLRTRPGLPTGTAPAGLQPLGITSGRDGLLYVPASLPRDQAAPLLVLLHGAGGAGSEWFGSWSRHADDSGIVLAAPDSRGLTWRMGARGTGQDARFVDRMLTTVSDRVSIDPQRVAVGGFSDGASYALGLGLTNGDLFSRVIAFSPGFLPASPPHGRPRVFVSHGTTDTILDIDRCSRIIVPMLRRSGYDVEYVEFEGGHQVPVPIRERALGWLAG